MAEQMSIVDRLLQDHQEVRQAFAKITAADSDERWALFMDLMNDLVRHEVAEEEIVYPVVRQEIKDGAMLASERVGEESKAEELLAQMEKKGRGDDGFTENLGRLKADVLAHAEAEELTVFPALAAVLNQERLVQLGDRFAKAKMLAPTHPHPNAPDSPPGNLVLGPVAAMADRLRDAIRKAT
ncbi:MAG TPA: hemerythrin domain-containing protein [Acidimicrobiales bacterium]|nr:hemerythrin domain-containing protein [Acidimicrobiales bacterium]